MKNPRLSQQEWQIQFDYKQAEINRLREDIDALTKQLFNSIRKLVEIKANITSELRK